MNSSVSSAVPTPPICVLHHTHFQGSQWCLLKKDEVVSRIMAMEVHRGHPMSLEPQHTEVHFPSRQRKKRTPSLGETEAANATLIKLQRKLEAQGKISLFFCCS